MRYTSIKKKMNFIKKLSDVMIAIILAAVRYSIENIDEEYFVIDDTAPGDMSFIILENIEDRGNRYFWSGSPVYL